MDAVVNGKQELKPSKNLYDWLGNGIYFWDNSPHRALKWAKALSKRPDSTINEPAVIGAIIDLGFCLDLLDAQYLSVLKKSYEILVDSTKKAGNPVPKNVGNTHDLLKRELDCAVIETLHRAMEIEAKSTFDSVRGVFWEGQELYPNAGFREKDHIQICVRNPNCIKGYFYPLDRIMN